MAPLCVDGEVTGAVMTVVAWMNGGEMVLALSVSGSHVTRVPTVRRCHGRGALRPQVWSGDW